MASVAPLVSTTSRLRAPRRAATCSRACSSATRDRMPSEWRRLGSPAATAPASVSHPHMASTASGRVGDVDA